MPSEWGNEILVNTITIGHQFGPAVTHLADGRFVAMWTDASGTLGDNTLSAVHGQVFNARGQKVGAEFLVNTLTGGEQGTPVITALADGRFVAAWSDLSTGAGNIRAQVFNLDGSKAAAEFLVNTTTSLHQLRPTIATLADGRYVMAWEDKSGGDVDIRAQIFNANGTKSGVEFVVSGGGGDQRQPVITALSDGRFVVAFTGADGSDGSLSSVVAQIFDPAGNEWGFPFRANTTLTNSQQQQVMTALADGRFVIAWTDYSATGGDVRAQVFSFDGTKSGPELLVNTTTLNEQAHPTIATLNDGRFVVAFADASQSPDDPSFTAVRAQVFNPNGTKSGGEFRANLDTTFGNQGAPSIAVLADGRFVVAWSDLSSSADDTSGYAVRAQIFDPRASGVLVTGTGLDDDLVGGEFNDTIVGGAGRDFLAGGFGDDVIEGGPGADYLDGGGQLDTASYASSSAGVTVSLMGALGSGGDAEGDSLADFVNLTGSAYNDILIGGGENSILKGGGRDDLLDGGFGDDTLIGGAGNDTFIVDSLADTIVENPNEGIDEIRTALATYELITLPHVENLTGLSASGQTLIGNARDNLITGRSGNDTLIGGGGNDTLVGLGGDDTMTGGIDNDTYVVDSLGDVVVENAGQGTDTVRTALASYSLAANVESLIGIAAGGQALSGNALANLITGGGGNDTLDGAGNADTMIGGLGNDNYFVDNAGDATVENAGEGIDTAYSAISHGLGVNIENLVLLTGAANGSGNALDNVMTGNGGNNLLAGGGGNDTLIGGLGNDTIEGGAEDDTAVFAHSLNSYTLMDFGAKILVLGPDGTDTLSGIEHLQFADATLTPVDDGDPLFDTLYYLSRNADVFHAGINAREHFNVFGWHEGRDPNGFFSASQYLAANADVRAAGMNPLDHYHQVGWNQGRDPSAAFDTTLYRLRNPDVGTDPLAHFLAQGWSEGRVAYAAVGQGIVGGFDAEYYLMHNLDVAAAGVDPLAHFNLFGWHEGRNPNGWFDTTGYLAHYADVAAGGANPLQHYMQFGWHEGRDPSALFDTLGYLAANPDVAAAGSNPLEHYLTFGVYEGRQAVNDGLWH